MHSNTNPILIAWTTIFMELNSFRAINLIEINANQAHGNVDKIWLWAFSGL